MNTAPRRVRAATFAAILALVSAPAVVAQQHRG